MSDHEGGGSRAYRSPQYVRDQWWFDDSPTRTTRVRRWLANDYAPDPPEGEGIPAVVVTRHGTELLALTIRLPELPEPGEAAALRIRRAHLPLV